MFYMKHVLYKSQCICFQGRRHCLESRHFTDRFNYVGERGRGTGPGNYFRSILNSKGHSTTRGHINYETLNEISKICLCIAKYLLARAHVIDDKYVQKNNLH